MHDANPAGKHGFRERAVRGQRDDVVDVVLVEDMVIGMIDEGWARAAHTRSRRGDRAGQLRRYATSARPLPRRWLSPHRSREVARSRDLTLIMNLMTC